MEREATAPESRLSTPRAADRLRGVKTPLLRYRAGPRALALLRRRGLGPGTVKAVVGPASGPRWLVLAGLDRALLDSGLLDGDGRVLLAGASAGAWRLLTFAHRDPHDAHRRLTDGYVDQVFSRRDPPVISAAYRRMLSELLRAEEVLDHPRYDLAVHTARLRLPRRLPGLTGGLLAAWAVDALTERATDWFFERVLFHSRPERFEAPFDGRLVPLTEENLLAAAQASAAVPYYLEAVRDPPGAPAGVYVDGGLTDYHLNQAYFEDGDGIVLLPHFQRRIARRWVDKRRPSRRLTPELAAPLLQVYPSPEFVATLPGGAIPDRDDFLRFMDDPQRRIRRWRAVVAASEALGEAFLADLETGRIADRVEPL